MTQYKKVLVIGAGLAGLSAAKKLMAEKIEVLVLEARDRIGGRTWTDSSQGVPIDEGAFIIHGVDNNPIAKLATELNLNFVKVEIENAYFPKETAPISNADYAEIDNQFQALLEEAHRFAKKSPHDMPLEDALKAVFDLGKYALLTPKILAWKKLFLAHYTGGNIKKLSARHWQEDEAMLGGGNHIMLDGYKPIVMELAKNIPVELNTFVNEIHYDADGVTVKTSRGAFKADAVIVTLPLGILKNMPDLFHPALPAAKEQAIKNLQMGVLDKIALRFPHRFWPHDCLLISFLRDTYPQIAWFFNYSLHVDTPILIGFVSDDVARRYENLTDAEVIAEAMLMLRDAFGNDTPEPVSYLITRWNNDPYSLGSYSYIPVNASGADYDRLAEPVAGKLFFAGEATNKRVPGTTHGALLSGLRAADELMGKKHN